MTTIAYRNGVMAADTLLVSGRTKNGYATKIRRLANGSLAGAAGSLAQVISFLDWFSGGLVGEAPKMKVDSDNEAEAIVITPDGRCAAFFDCGWEHFRGPYFAVGTGTSFALGAMACGASAEQAVRAAAAHDLATGGEITVLRR